MNKQIILWTAAPLLGTAALLGLTNSNVSSEFCNYLPFRCALSIFASGVGGMLILAPFVAAIAGIWYLFSKDRSIVPLVAGWSFLLLSIAVMAIGGEF